MWLSYHQFKTRIIVCRETKSVKMVVVIHVWSNYSVIGVWILLLLYWWIWNISCAHLWFRIHNHNKKNIHLSYQKYSLSRFSNKVNMTMRKWSVISGSMMMEKLFIRMIVIIIKELSRRKIMIRKGSKIKRKVLHIHRQGLSVGLGRVRE